MPRQPPVLLATAWLLLALEGLAIFLPPRPPSELSGYVRRGMSLIEVTTLFGKPPDLDAPAGGGMRNRIWMTREGAVAMQFDAADRVTERDVLRGQPPTWIEQFRARVKW
jgi:hypothetical protein